MKDMLKIAEIDRIIHVLRPNFFQPGDCFISHLDAG